MTQRQHQDALSVNVAGHQRLLSQQIVTLAVLLQDASDGKERERMRVELKTTLDRWAQVHDALLHDRKDRWPNEQDDTPSRRAVEDQYRALRNATVELLAVAEATDSVDRESVSRTVRAIRAHQSRYLIGMEAIVYGYTREAAGHVLSVRVANVCIALSTCVLLVFIACCVYTPAARTIRRQMEELQEAADAVREKRELAIVNARLNESESRFRSLLNSTAEGIYGLNVDGNCTFANAACLRLLGYESVDDVLGKNMHELIHHTRCDGIPYPVEECCIYRAFQEGQGTHVDSEVLWRADGTSFASEYWSYPMSEDGQIIGSVVTFLDISERRKMQQDLRKSEAQVLYRAVAEAAETESCDDALKLCIEKICKLTGWPVGNSAYYNSAGKKTVDLAEIVVRMGRKRIGELALRASVYGAMTKQKIPWLDVTLAWKRSIAAGVAVDLIVSQGCHKKIQKGLFLSAIMHPLGRIVLAANHSEEHRALTEECRRNGEPLALAERRAFGKSHAQGTAELLEQWNIPSEVTVPLRHTLDSYSSLSTLHGDAQTRVELVKMAMLIGRIAVGHWDPADLVEFPPRDVVGKLGIRALTDLIQQTRINCTAIINSRARSDVAGPVQPTMAVQRVGYCHLADEAFDFLAAMFPSLGIEPLYSGLQHESRVLVNAWEAEAARLTARYTSGSDQELMIVANEGHQEEFQEHGRVLVLPNSYSRLREMCRGSAKDAAPREACIA